MALDGMSAGGVRSGLGCALIASEVSLDPKSAAEGGDLGWLSPLSTRYHLLRRNVFSLPPGEAVGPIQDKEGFSFFKVTNVRKLPYENIAEAVQQALIAHKNGTATMDFLSTSQNKNGRLGWAAKEAEIGEVVGR